MEAARPCPPKFPTQQRVSGMASATRSACPPQPYSTSPSGWWKASGYRIYSLMSLQETMYSASQLRASLQSRSIIHHITTLPKKAPNAN